MGSLADLRDLVAIACALDALLLSRSPLIADPAPQVSPAHTAG
jgi:hypothetical protein